MINQLLNTMYQLKIEIKETDNKTKLIYDPGLLNETLKNLIKQHKKGILQRLEENEAARNIGFLVYHHGLIYEYRYGLGAYIYIERHPSGLASAWRENYLPGQNQPFKSKIIVENVGFNKAFKDAKGFIEWLNKKRGRKVG
jgi:hypothetical protein